MLLVLMVALAAGIGPPLVRMTGAADSKPGPSPTAAALDYVHAWQAGDYDTMYRLISPGARRRTPFAAFRSAYGAVAATSTTSSLLEIGRPVPVGTGANVRIALRTRLYGRLVESMHLPLVLEPHGYRVSWRPQLAFPGLTVGEHLATVSHAPAHRGRILGHDGEVLAYGPADHRIYPQGAAFSVVTGYTRAPTSAQVKERIADGWSAATPYGRGGLEQSLDPILAGSPRIALVARSPSGATRTLAVHRGRAPRDVHTTLVPSLQAAAAAALGNRYGGVVVLGSNGAVRADVGLGMDALQPPGSSFKTITASAALRAKVATLDSEYAYARFVELDGWHLKNFHHEDCGGSLVLAFAVSCNSVFAPLADRVGAKRLVAAADAFGFNHKPTIAYPAPTSVTPAPASMPSDLSLGVAGIGQGGVDATPLQMASVALTIGSGGIVHPPFIIYAPGRLSDRGNSHRAIPTEIATEVRTMMEAVVTEGTGTSAAIAGVTVAGKTGTAEVGPGRPSDAWFIAFAPADNPTVAVAVLVVNGGVGGQTAAPIARQVLESALGLG